MLSNPTLQRKTDQRLTINNKTKRLFQVIYKEQVSPDDSEKPRISVSELVSKMAFYYEKLRNTVDYKEEHLLRKNAIERILRRQIIIEGAISIREREARDVSEHLLTELIRAAYLPNNKILESKIDEIGEVVRKYLLLKKQVEIEHKGISGEEKGAISKWIIALMASDIEERLGRSKVDLSVIDQIYEILVGLIRLPDGSSQETDREIQIYIGIYRNYLKFDNDMLGFILFKYFNGNWQIADEDYIRQAARSIRQVKQAVDDQINHPLANQLNRIISRYTMFMKMLVDTITEDPKKVYAGAKDDPAQFARQISEVCSKRYRDAKKKLWRAGIRSIAYIFITKSFLAVLLEVPATRFFGEEFNPLALAVNVAFPAFLLFLIILFTRVPSSDNTARIVNGIQEIIYEEKAKKEPYRLRKPVKRGTTLTFVFGLIYAVTFFISFGGVVWLLDQARFSFVSIIIFLFFLALVSFFANRIRKSTKEYLVTPPRESFLSFVADFFYIPIVQAGKWLSVNFSRVNVFVFVLDMIIEAPFKIFVQVTEEWTKYVKERKDELT
jgi:hypothetical protein